MATGHARRTLTGMTAVSVLTAANINLRKVMRTLEREGYTAVAHDGVIEVSRDGVVSASPTRLDDLPSDRLDVARRMLGLRPWSGVTCRFDGAVGAAETWTTVVDIARAVAAVVPLAVLDDHAGTTYLIHSKRGLVPPEEFNETHAPSSSTDFLRRLLGNG